MLRGTCLAVLGLGLLVSPASAQGDYPSRTVRIIVPATPGGGSDTFARLIAQHLAKELNQQFVVENRPGGGTLPAMEYVAGTLEEQPVVQVIPMKRFVKLIGSGESLEALGDGRFIGSRTGRAFSARQG